MKYRIPRIEEFVEGFEFEVYMKSGGRSFFILDKTIVNDHEEQTIVNKTATIEDWEKYTVPKIELSVDWCFSFSLSHYLKENKVRTLNLEL